MEDAPLKVNLSGDLTDTRLALLTRDLERDLSREGIDARTVDAASVPERNGKLANLGTLVVAILTSSALRALLAAVKAYLAREPSLVIKLTRADGMEVVANVHNVATVAELVSELIAPGRIKLGDLRAETGDATITNLNAGVEQKQFEAYEAARMEEERRRAEQTWMEEQDRRADQARMEEERRRTDQARMEEERRRVEARMAEESRWAVGAAISVPATAHKAAKKRRRADEATPMAEKRHGESPLEQHRMGSILWTLPQRMRVGQRKRVEVRLGDAGVAESQLREGLKGRSLPETDKLEVAPLMRVTLVSDPKDFDISSLNSPDQNIRPNSVARWDFYATPLRGGKRTLRILVSMRVKVESKDEIVDLPSYERDVIVAVAPFHATASFVSKNWQWAAGTILIPLLVWAATKTDAGSALLKQVIGGFSIK